MTRRTSALRFTAVVAAVVHASAAFGQTPSASDEATRGELITRAQDAHKNGDHRAAIDLAGRAASIRKSLTLWSFLAEEQEEVGALVDAYATAQRCVRESALDREAMLRTEAVERCKSLVERLKGRLGKVVIDAPSPPPGLSIVLSGQELNLAQLGVEKVITPGKVVVEARAPGRTPYRIEVDVPEGKTVAISVALAPDAAATPPVVSAVAPAPATAVVTGPTPAPARVSRAAIVVGAAGGAALITAGALWLVASGRFDDLETKCAAGCTQSDRQSGINSIDRLDTWAAGLAIGGVALVGAAAVFQWALPASDGRQASVGVDPVGRTVRLWGRF